MTRLKTQAEVVRGRKYSLGYGAVEDTTRRRKTVSKTQAELSILTPTKRDAASATVQEDRRNMTLLAWMIRRHLDNVSRFTPHFRLAAASPEGQAALEPINSTVRRLLTWHAHRRQFDALGRHGRDEWLRMFEACKVIQGDCGGLKAEGGRLQGIEGDRIRKPTDMGDKAAPQDVTADGLTFDATGRRSGFCVCRRTTGTGMVFERVVAEADMVFDGYWPDRFDSNRGVSPLLTALNEGADVRETWEWLVLKAKTSALFGLAFTRTGSDDIFPTAGDPATSVPTSEATAYTTQVTNAIKSRSLINLDLDPGDTVTEIQSDTPNPNVIPFTRELIRSVLLALDIPFTFYDSLTASFSARIADRNEYEESCEWKRAKNQDVLDDIYGGWLLEKWAAADLFGFGKALKTANISTDEVAASLRWVPAGRPWLDRSNEMSGHILALTAGVTSTPRICAAYGDDAYEIAAEQRAYLEQAGAPLLYAQGGQVAVQAIMAGMGQKPAEPTGNQNANPEAE
jgi:capsid protein